ncbi:hypothetical protein PHM2_183 [Prochlorococcus phage P-HM2]|uniref:Uncharacterized protein n=1 Tax=Prochlorococcus phage P-HM2 TaxID=445696 RepID=E3ST33_9CAUD|nr:hypothetical protein PHM2_183 [Prochlorococcus phage P-HM2]ADO99961.1 hypothetical protein PHM2_183 [Prochlorococcus phage P-HM2]
MRTHGSTKIQLSLLTILAISSVSSTALQIYNQASNTSDANTSINSESLEVSLGKLSLKVTGKNTMGVVMNLLPIESLLETNVSNVK